MLALIGFLAIAVLLALLLSNRVTAIVALIGVPVLAAVAAGFTPGDITGFVGSGIAGVAETATMFVFAILYFGVVRDAGLFDPIVRRVLRFAGHNPVTIAIATVALAMATHLDGAGATTFLITIPAMLPLYDALGMRRLVLAALTGLGAGIMNMVPWGGPGVRAASTLGVDANEIWVPLIPAQLAGVVACFGVAYLLGRRERSRIAAADAGQAGATATTAGAGIAGTGPAADTDEATATTATAAERGAAPTATATRPTGPDGAPGPVEPAPPGKAGAPGAAANGEDAEQSDGETSLRRPRLFWFNAALTATAIGVLISGLLPPHIVFMLALVVALIVNYPGMKLQTDRINAHAHGAILMASTLLAAGVFLGVMEESGMIEGMANALTSTVPESAVPGLPLVVGVLGVPLSLVFGPDAYYYAVLPVLNAVGETFGVASMDITQASLAGQETVGFPISPLTGAFYLLTGMAGVSIGAHIRFLLPWVWLVSLVVLAVAVLTGVVPLWAA